MKAYGRLKKSQRRLYATFDLETEGLGGKVLAASFMREGDDKPGYIYTGNIIAKLFNYMAANAEFQWYAHNAQYEFRYLLDHISNYINDVRLFNRTDTDFYRIEFDFIDDNDELVTLQLCDSFAIYPIKLADFTRQFSPELPKLELDLSKTTFNPRDPYHVEYSKRDAHALLISLINFDTAVFDLFGIHLKATTASTAIAAWRATIPKGVEYFPDRAAEKMALDAYYGGLVFLTDTREYSGCRSYDRNSSYPASMEEHGAPYGDFRETTFLVTDKVGIYDVTVTAPDDLIVPILPRRDKHGILWNRGTFRTTITSPELHFALAHGYRLHAIHKGIVWDQTIFPWGEIVGKCKSIRLEYAGTSYEAVAKLMQNSIYGKYASKKTRRKYTAEETVDAEPWGEFWAADETDDDMLTMPHWSAFITAHARLALLKEVYEIGPENVLYGDTDSITLKPGFTMPEGKEYGAWKLDKTWLKFRARAPKVYAGLRLTTGKERDAGEGPLKMAGAIKGIPKRHWSDSGALDAVLRAMDVTVTFESLETFCQSLKTSYIGLHTRTRSLSELSRSRSWRLNADGSVRPALAGEAMVRSAKPVWCKPVRESLAEYLANRGGIAIERHGIKLMGGADLLQIGAAMWHRRAVFRRRLITDGGMAPDAATLSAWQAGFFPSEYERPEIDTLIRALEGEMRGVPLYRPDEMQFEFDMEVGAAYDPFDPNTIEQIA